MKEVLRSPEKQLAEVMRHPFPVLGLKLDMAFLKAVCNGSTMPRALQHCPNPYNLAPYAG